MKKIILAFLLIALFTTGCGGLSQPVNPSPVPSSISPTPVATATQVAKQFPWWNDTVFYEIFVRSFQDSNGDGIGDFNGVTEKLDYLQNLGIKGIWLMPINPSPSYHGYDVTDYYAVNPEYGTMDDFKRLLEEAHKRDIKIIIDFVMNHTSSQHPWFQASLDPQSEYHNWYKWSETDPATVGPWGQKAWYQASNGLYYYAIFWDQMPDLNYDTSAVREEMKKITSFWLKDVGIDGFRLDAARYLVEEGRENADAAVNHEFLKDWRKFYRQIDPQAFTVGEIWTENFTVSTYTKDDTELDSAFNFDLSGAILKGLNDGSNSTLNFTLKSTIKLFPQQDNSNFLTNHDMPRVMTQLGGDEEKAKVAAGILLTMPGIPFIYYGEEIGMKGNKPDEMIRTPMQWDDTPGAGFTTGTPWEPVNSDHQFINVARLTGRKDSLLEYYRTLIQLRNGHTALKTGDTFVADPSSRELVSYLRAEGNEVFLIVANLGKVSVGDYKLELTAGPLSGVYNAVSLLDGSEIAPLQANSRGGFDGYLPISELPPYSIRVIQLTK